jgi:hypothetical protein
MHMRNASHRPFIAAMLLIFCLLVIVSAKERSAAAAPAGPETAAAPKAARSVHLWWNAPEGTDFYNELTVEKSTRGSYFMACGFAHGYFGMQELNGKPRGLAGDDGKTDKVVIFSVWDTSKGDNPKAVPEDRRVEVLAQGENVRIGRFGGEGTGAQSFYTYPWKIGETCRFYLRAKVEGEKTAYSAYFFRNDAKQWQHLATFRTITKGKALSGYYSFVEDFRRDGKSPGETRLARFGNGWVRGLDGQWTELTKARFTADRTPLDTIDAGVRDGTYFLATGGEITNQTTKLKETMTREAGKGSAPADLPK